jgi:hypothetical protein
LFHSQRRGCNPTQDRAGFEPAKTETDTESNQAIESWNEKKTRKDTGGPVAESDGSSKGDRGGKNRKLKVTGKRDGRSATR